ncbi:ROK family protein, partial [Actinomadura sp. DSM 109109]
MLSVGIDIGGTKVAAGVVDESGQIVRRIQRLTPSRSPEAVEDAIVESVRELARNLPICA